MKNLLVLLAVALMFIQCTENQNGIAGTWRTQIRGVDLVLTLNEDSTLTESIYGNNGKWTYKEADDTVNSVPRINLTNAVGETNSFDLILATTDSLVLKKLDTRYKFSRHAGDNPEPVNTFSKFRLLFNSAQHNVLISTPLEVALPLRQQYLPDIGFLTGTALVDSDSLFALTADDYVSGLGAVFDATGNRLDLRELWQSDGCTARYEVTAEDKQIIIKQIQSCGDDGGVSAIANFFTINNDGKFERLESSTLPEPHLKKLITEVFRYDKHLETNENGVITFKSVQFLGYQVYGSYQMMGDFLITSLVEDMDDHDEVTKKMVGRCFQKRE